MKEIRIEHFDLEYIISIQYNWKKIKEVYIQNQDEEGMSISEEKFFKLIDNFFKKEF